jgi:hypothetical protein
MFLQFGVYLEPVGLPVSTLPLISIIFVVVSSVRIKVSEWASALFSLACKVRLLLIDNVSW